LSIKIMKDFNKKRIMNQKYFLLQLNQHLFVDNKLLITKKEVFI
jgi:hypothetical protein